MIIERLNQISLDKPLIARTQSAALDIWTILSPSISPLTLAGIPWLL